MNTDVFEKREMMMYLKRLKTTAEPLYTPAIELYESAFPTVERRDEAEQLRVMAKDDYHFELIMTEAGFCGIMLYWETAEFLFLEHFATLPALRGQGIGSAALELLKAKGKTVILEIEPPVDTLTRCRRGFYERCGDRIEGVGVVCVGGNDPAIRRELTELISAACGIRSNKIFVTGGGES